jgi:hypothetical protein
MLPADPRQTSTATLALGLGLILLGLAFATRVWQETLRHSTRPEDPDRRYYRSRWIRRSVGAALLVAIGVAMIVLSGVEKPANVGQARQAVWGWIAVLGLLVALLITAALDWAANTRYAMRQRRALLDDQRKTLAELALRKRARRQRGSSFNDPSLN